MIRYGNGACAAGIALALAGAALAQPQQPPRAAAGDYPIKPIRMIVPSAQADAPASSEQGSRLRDAIVRESAVDTVKVHAGVAFVFGVASPKGAPAPPYDGVPGLVSRRPVRGEGAQSAGFYTAALAITPHYPSKPIRMIVPSAPGGGTDIVARVVAQGLSDAWGQTVVVDNRGGAGGTAGVTVAAKASAPDGYTLLLGSNGHLSFAPAVNRHLPYDPQKDLAPVSLVAQQPFVVGVNAGLPVGSMKEFIAYAKSRPGTVTYGSGGNGSASHLGTELLQLTAGFSMLHVPYKGTGPGMAALMSGELQFLMAGLATVMPHSKSGKIKALAVTGATRSKVAPDVPTVAEAGVPGYEFVVWYGMMVPGGTPKAIITKINAEIARVLRSPATRERYAAAGLEPISNSPEEFAAQLEQEIPRWQQVVKAANIHVE